MRVATSPHDFKLMVAAAGKPGRDPARPSERRQARRTTPAPPRRRPRPRHRRAVARRRRRRRPSRRRRWPPRRSSAPRRRPPPPRRRRRRPRRRGRHLLSRRVCAALATGRSEADGRACRRRSPSSTRRSRRTRSRCRTPSCSKVRLDQVTIQAKLGSMVAYQGDVTFEHAGSGGIGRMLKKARHRRGHAADEDHRQRRGVPGRPGAGRPPDLPRERLHHGQRPEPARVRLRHRLGHQARRGRQRR